ncbi:uncharacterized protein LOC132790077 [Drosophila nasuta]|uniref:uncharacterized protein LOC132790077 n=1 Tax=Drosophila nasuta TaxID=42062 RepID=UPI00295F4B66|nr:uncharacterized protein LOC132790077 [Drosophila nasuta]
MSLNKQNVRKLIGLVVMGLSLSTCLLSNRSQSVFLGLSRALQVFATIIMIFGIRKAYSDHKPKILLFWLVISSFFCTALIYITIDYVAYNGYYYRFELYWATVAPSLAVAAVLYLMNIIYKEYVELTHGTPQFEEVKLKPPPYESDLHKFLVSVNE